MVSAVPVEGPRPAWPALAAHPVGAAVVAFTAAAAAVFAGANTSNETFAMSSVMHSVL